MFSVVGNESVSVEYNRLSGCYWSNFQEIGIKLVPILDRTFCKRIWNNLTKESCIIKHPCLDSNHNFDHLLSFAAFVLKRHKHSFNIFACEIPIDTEPLSSKGENSKQIQPVREKRKRH